MYRAISLAAAIAVATLQGCATSPHAAQAGSAATAATTIPDASQAMQTDSKASASVNVAQVTEVPMEKDAPDVEGHPLTSVVVTQCNLIVAVYMTMPDGRLLRFDHSAQVPPDQLMNMAYSATRSERVEVSCHDAGPEGYETHNPV